MLAGERDVVEDVLSRRREVVAYVLADLLGRSVVLVRYSTQRSGRSLLGSISAVGSPKAVHPEHIRQVVLAAVEDRSSVSVPTRSKIENRTQGEHVEATAEVRRLRDECEADNAGRDQRQEDRDPNAQLVLGRAPRREQAPMLGREQLRSNRRVESLPVVRRCQDDPLIVTRQPHVLAGARRPTTRRLAVGNDANRPGTDPASTPAIGVPS